MRIITTNERFDKLTNLDISTHYRNRKYWFMKNDLLSAFAYWVVKQSPDETPNITKPLKSFNKYVSTLYDNQNMPIEINFDRLSDIISGEKFEEIPDILALNIAKENAPSCDFIDLYALARNVFYMILRENITQ